MQRQLHLPVYPRKMHLQNEPIVPTFDACVDVSNVAHHHVSDGLKCTRPFLGKRENEKEIRDQIQNINMMQRLLMQPPRSAFENQVILPA